MKTNKEIKKLFQEHHEEYDATFEINLKEYIDGLEEDVYTYTHYNYNEENNMLELGGMCNAGFLRSDDGIEYFKHECMQDNINALEEHYIQLTVQQYNDNPEDF